MNRTLRRIVTALVVTSLALAGTAAFADGVSYVWPPAGSGYPGAAVWPPVQPRLGFSYYCIPGYGYQVTGVTWGSPAAQMGLEVSDVVLSINGHSLNYNGAHYYALQSAASQGGWVQLAIRDWRTGMIVYRSANLFGYSGGGYMAAPAAAMPY